MRKKKNPREMMATASGIDDGWKITCVEGSARNTGKPASASRNALLRSAMRDMT